MGAPGTLLYCNENVIIDVNSVTFSVKSYLRRIPASRAATVMMRS